MLTLGSSILEGTQESLARLQLDYVDIIFAHRADPNGMYASGNDQQGLLTMHFNSSSDGGRYVIGYSQIALR